MNIWLRILRNFAFLLLFWILVFDFQRILFSIHNLDRLSGTSFWEWIQVFFQSIRLDITTGSLLSAIPLILITVYSLFPKRILIYLFKLFIIIELLLVVFIHSGEINAYAEWNSKLSARVFVHLINPDEVFRTADYSMTIWFVVYSILEIIFGIKILNWLFKQIPEQPKISWKLKTVILIPILPLLLGFYFLFARGGWQQIPINIDAAYYSKNYVLNDVSVNSPYFFGKSFILYRRSNIGEFLSNYKESEIEQILHDFYTYDKTSEIEILNTKKPNIIFLILESWTAKVSNRITGEPGASPEFDSLSKEGILFTNIYSTSTTSEVGNSSIFSGYPALPEIFITMQPAKHRKLTALNQTLKPLGYTAGFYFSGDLKYGNIGSYFNDHGFERIHDESDFPAGYRKGKLNYYDEDLFKLFLHEINQQKEPFLECAFTGSTHSPYDCPAPRKAKWKGKEADFMNSVLYADECISDFIKNASKEPWYQNTLFVIVADHGHASPYETNPNSSEFYHIPLLFYGPALKDEVKGLVIDKIGSQSDIAQTLLQQLNIQTDDYPWSKNLLSAETPPYALHATTRGFGWVSPRGKFTFHLDYQKYLTNTFESEEALSEERKRCDALMQLLYKQYLDL